MKRSISWTLVITLLCGGIGKAQSNIDPASKFSWGENIGWANWRPSDTDGVRVGDAYLSGLIWCENVGWINVGDGSPGNGTHYANTDGSDFGVNVDGSGDLYGLAWGENIGWLNFDTRLLGALRGRVDRGSNRLRGYVWGENVGWLNLDDESKFIGLVSTAGFLRGDCSGDGRHLLDDVICTLLCLFVSKCPPCPDANDLNDDGKFTLSDIIHLLLVLFAPERAPHTPEPFEACGRDPTPDDGLGCDLPLSNCP